MTENSAGSSHSKESVVTLDKGLGARLKRDFPLLRDSSIVFLDSAASAQKPEAVLDAQDRFYRAGYANIHRGVYELSANATVQFDLVREKVAQLLNAQATEEIIFTSGATESFNLVAYSWGRSQLRVGDEIIVSLLEHHANFVPWQQLANEVGAKIKYVAPDQDGVLQLATVREAITDRTRLVAVTALANAIGTATPIKEIIDLSHAVGAVVVVDAAQSITHGRTDVQALDADFLAFSGHKLYGPTGTGVLYGKRKLLDLMPPFLTGGDMIVTVGVEGTTFAEPPHRFEAGTPNIAGIVGLGAAIDYFIAADPVQIEAYELFLVGELERKLAAVEGIRILGPIGRHRGLVTFVSDLVHPHDMAQVLSSKQVAVRAGHHCAQPLMKHLGITASTRASVALYTTEEDIDALVGGVQAALSFFSR